MGGTVYEETVPWVLRRALELVAARVTCETCPYNGRQECLDVEVTCVGEIVEWAIAEAREGK